MRIGLIILLMHLTTIGMAQANQCRDLLSLASETVLFKHTNPITYTQVEVFRKNNDMGPQQMGRLTFETWFELSFEFDKKGDDISVLGLTETGAVFHLIQIEGRTIAKKLNGDRRFQDISVTNHGKILALNEKGLTEVFSPSLWATPAKTLAIKQWLKLFSLTSTIGIVGAQFFPPLDMPIEVSLPLINLTLFSFNFPLYETILIFAGGMSSGFAALSKYQHLNTFPDGFVKVNLDFDNPYWFDNIVFSGDILKGFDPQNTERGTKLDTEFTQDIE